MAQVLRLARRPVVGGAASTEKDFPERRAPQSQGAPLRGCEHRAVSRDGRIICGKITEGEPEVSPNTCRDCPFKAVDCGHLRFSLRLSSPSPLVVRFNGRTEVWDDGPPGLSFERAACAARVMPIHSPRACAGCALRQPLQEGDRTAPEDLPFGGRVVPFPEREPVAAAG